MNSNEHNNWVCFFIYRRDRRARRSIVNRHLSMPKSSVFCILYSIYMFDKYYTNIIPGVKKILTFKYRFIPINTLLYMPLRKEVLNLPIFIITLLNRQILL